MIGIKISGDYTERGLCMKIDMHCHVKEGLIDSKVGVEEYITILKAWFSRMVITDHDTYNGYRYWKRKYKRKEAYGFCCIERIEYDTRDASISLLLCRKG